MKKFFSILVVCLFSFSVLAGEIVITPGSTIVLSPDTETTVTCEGTNVSDYDYCRCVLEDDQRNPDMTWVIFRYRKIGDEMFRDRLRSGMSSEENCNYSINEQILCKR